ncbi:MAG: hypothetical protein JSV39_01125 [Candidatus Aenigmatarchaeota archaeon]|nr:MAG: hypothetical protein JSV39_01125 [Candidatus Aenigmarchaeota archaeon]
MSLFGGKENFRNNLKDKVKSLYIAQLRDHYGAISKKEIKYHLKNKKHKLREIVVSKAGEFWYSKEEEPNQATLSLAMKPYIPTLIKDFDTIENEIQKPYDQKTIKTEKGIVSNFISDEQRLVFFNLEEHGPRFVKNPLKCNRVIAKVFKYLESVMNFEYGKDKENFGYDELWLTPTQVMLLRESNNESARKKKIDCEDMHNYGATCLFVARVPESRYRCVAGEKEFGKGGHVTLFVLDDSLETWRNLEFTPNYRNIHGPVRIREFPEFGDPQNSMHGKKILFSYNNDRIFSTFNPSATKNDFNAFVDSISIKFPKEMFD